MVVLRTIYRVRASIIKITVSLLVRETTVQELITMSLVTMEARDQSRSTAWSATARWKW